MTGKGIVSFLLGAGVGVAVATNRRQVRRGIAKAVVRGEEAAVSASKHVVRISSEMMEDFQDALAEARAEKQAEQAAQPDALIAMLQQIQQDLQILKSSPKSSVQ